MKPGAVIIEGHVQGLALTRALGKAGIPIIVIDTNKCIAQFSKFCNKFFNCPAYYSDQFIDFLINISGKEQLDGWIILPSNDYAVMALSENRSVLSRYYKILGPDERNLQIILNKLNLLDAANQIGLPIIQTWYFNKINDPELIKITYPVITKGIFGLQFYKTFSQKAIVSNSESELVQNLEIINNKYNIVKTYSQEIIPSVTNDNVYSFTAFSINGNIQTFWMGQKLREHPEQFGTATLCKSIFNKQLIVLARPLIKKLNYSGICEIEFIKDPRDNTFKLIEINARTWLWVDLAIKCGINYPIYIYNHLNDIPQKFPDYYEIGIKWINWITDTYYSLKFLLTGGLTWSKYLSQLKGRKIKATWDPYDPLPSFAFIYLAFRFKHNR